MSPGEGEGLDAKMDGLTDSQLPSKLDLGSLTYKET
jgi:hypothetical protein